MGFARLERDPQRLVGPEQMLLADHLVNIAGPQALGERDIGTGFFKHGVLRIISAVPGKVGDNRALFGIDALRTGAKAGAQRGTACIMTAAATEQDSPHVNRCRRRQLRNRGQRTEQRCTPAISDKTGTNTRWHKIHSPANAGSTYAPLTPVPDARRAFAHVATPSRCGSRSASACWSRRRARCWCRGCRCRMRLPAIVIGSVIGVVLLALAGVVGTDTGLAAMSSLRPTLGVRGASVPAVLNAVQLVGWGSFEVIVMRDSADALAKQSFGLSMPLIWTLVFGLLATLLAISGPLSFVRRFLRTWGIWLLLAGAAWLSWNLLAKHDLAALMRRPGTGDMSFGGGIDLVVAMPLSWLPLIADYTRFGRRAGEYVPRHAARLRHREHLVLCARRDLRAGGGRRRRAADRSRSPRPAAASRCC